jgi:hypothetical protein
MITAMTAPLNHYLPGSIMINLTNKYITLQFFFPKEFKLTRDSSGHDISHTLTGVSKWGISHQLGRDAVVRFECENSAIDVIINFFMKNIPQAYRPSYLWF